MCKQGIAKSDREITKPFTREDKEKQTQENIRRRSSKRFEFEEGPARV
jgi:hypothetical protein